jgi:hypothetical protein
LLRTPPFESIAFEAGAWFDANALELFHRLAARRPDADPLHASDLWKGIEQFAKRNQFSHSRQHGLVNSESKAAVFVEPGRSRPASSATAASSVRAVPEPAGRRADGRHHDLTRRRYAFRSKGAVRPNHRTTASWA